MVACDATCGGIRTRLGAITCDDGEAPRPPQPIESTVIDLPLTGGCNCGAVRYGVTAPLVAASYCHCKRCQRRSGAAASPNAHPAPGTFRIVSGHDQLRVWKPDGGGEKWFCGTRVAPRSTPRALITRTRSGSAWAASTTTPGSFQAFVSSSRTQHNGSQSPTTGCHATPRVATHEPNPDDGPGTPASPCHGQTTVRTRHLQRAEGRRVGSRER
jgi:hypothetical protein